MDLEKLTKFLVKAKRATYASENSKEVNPERSLHKELEFEDEGLCYRDSYIGFFQASGMEEVRGRTGETFWTMAYSGGMLTEFQYNIEFAKETFTFLKKALSLVEENAPFRGPEKLEVGDWKYINKFQGYIRRFSGHEKIIYKGKEVFNQDYIGGVIIKK
ncbi:hypothetical protein KAT80_02820 [Candidatus Pacearchaeota archaeon]|nr:hypothetical protein [Candidatus Pacearchaeota archaeon]